jgi:hypothetical protein
MSQVLQTNCDYKIKTQAGGTITLDVGSATSGGQVVVTADLIVQGEQTTVNTTDLFIEDNIITLNKGETGNGVTLVRSGIEIDRGLNSGVQNDYAVFQFNETSDAWEIVFRNSQISSYNNSVLKLRKITTDSFTDGGDLILLGTSNSVVKVDGTNNYEQNVQGDDDIPNKRYVDLAILNRDPENRIQRDDTYVIVKDVDGGASGVAIMAIKNIAINQAGLGYAQGDIVSINEGSRIRDTIIRVDTVLGGGAIDTFTVLDSGLFAELPVSNFNITTLTNSQFGASATFDMSFEVAEVQLSNPGDDYQTATVSFIDVGGNALSNAVATATVDSDPFSITYRQIISVNISDGGEYGRQPTVLFSAGINNQLTESQAQVVVDGNLIATFYTNRAEIGGLEILGNTITNNNTNDNIVLRTQGTAAVEIPRALQFNVTGEVIPAIPGASLVYGDFNESPSAQPTPGGTGIFYNNVKQTLSWQQWVTNNPDPNITAGNLAVTPAKNELISKQKALVFSMLF